MALKTICIDPLSTIAEHHVVNNQNQTIGFATVIFIMHMYLATFTL
jgi:hypothetical protein